jgi:hypothetical protein
VWFVFQPSSTRVIERDGDHAICRLCFGTPVHQGLVPGETEPQTAYEFLPGQIFGVAWWRRGRRGRQHWTIAIAQAGRPAGLHGLDTPYALDDLPGINRPVGVIAMLDQAAAAGQDGSVDRMLELIADVRKQGIDPALVRPEYWCQAAHAIMLRRRLPVLEERDLLPSEQNTCES